MIAPTDILIGRIGIPDFILRSSMSPCLLMGVDIALNHPLDGVPRSRDGSQNRRPLLCEHRPRHHRIRNAPRQPRAPATLLESHMSTQTEKLTDKLDEIATRAKDEVEKVVERVVDSVNDAAHAVVEKARQQTEKAGEKVIEAGEKITKLAQ